MVSVGASGLEGQVGPCGPVGTEQRATLQLRYLYSCNPIKSVGGLHAIVLSAGTGPADAVKDPDKYPLVFT